MAYHPPGSLMAFLAEVPDPRDASGKRHPLTAMLAHACCAILCGCRGYAAIAQWGRDQPIGFMHGLGYRRRPPSFGCFQGLFSRLDAAALEAALARWADRLLGPRAAESLRAVALDGKSRPVSSNGTKNWNKGRYAARSSRPLGSRSGRNSPCRTESFRTNSYRPSTLTCSRSRGESRPTSSGLTSSPAARTWARAASR